MRTGLSTREFSLIDLGTMISTGDMVLADFQRDFDWNESDIKSFLATLLMGWPAGSLLLVEGEPSHVELRPFEEGPSITGPVVYTVLDGQQRLTSIFYALYDKGPTVYAARVSDLSEDSIDALEQGLQGLPRDEWDERLRDAAWDGPDGWVPMYALRDPSTYFRWRDGVVATAPPELEREITLSLANLYSQRLSVIHEYPLAAVLISSDLEEGAVARIFERLNRKGEILGSFDLVVARVYEPRWNLRFHWDDARLADGLLDYFLGENGLPVLQAIALHRDQNVRQKAVLELPKTVIHDQWPDAHEAMSAALSFLVDSCGVRRRDWIPYGNQLIILAALAMDFPLSAHESTLRAWFLSRAYALRFDAAANTRAVTEYLMLADVLRGRADLVVDSADRRTLLEATRRRQSAIWRAFMCTLALQGPIDLGGEELVLDPLNGSTAVPISIAPRSGDELPETERIHLRVLSQILASRATATQIRRDGIAAAVDAAENAGGFVQTQLFPELPATPGLGIDWSQFLDHRLDRLSEFLATTVGQSIETRNEIGVFLADPPIERGQNS